MKEKQALIDNLDKNSPDQGFPKERKSKALEI